MNYYDHHIGDYDSETAHLSWLEDMAYTRLLRLYYRKESPIPADLKEACRKVRAASKAEKQAVEAVLNEFFDLQEDGWHQKTCDENIAAYLAGEPEREAKKANEEIRLKRHRDERAALFQELTSAGLHAAWNIGIKELRDMVKSISATPAITRPATAPATPATATQTPDTNTHTPVLIKTEASSAVDNSTVFGEDEYRKGAPLPEFQEPKPETTPAVQLSVALRKQHVSVTAIHPALLDWVAKGISLTALTEAIAIIRMRPGKETGPINPNYLNVVLADVLSPQAGKASPVQASKEWWESASGIAAEGQRLGLEQSDGENFAVYKAKVLAAAGDGPWAWKDRGASTQQGLKALRSVVQQ